MMETGNSLSEAADDSIRLLRQPVSPSPVSAAANRGKAGRGAPAAL